MDLIALLKQWGPAALSLAVVVALMIYQHVFAKSRDTLRIGSLWIFPIKSCAGVQVTSAVINRLGFQWDRNWMIVLEKSQKFITQREYPQMALIRPEVNEAAGKLVVSIPGQSPISVDLELKDDAVTWDVILWKVTLKAKVYDGQINELLSEYIGVPCRLVRVISTTQHERKLAYTEEQKLKAGDDFKIVSAAFPDEEPFLVASEESLIDLNRTVLQNTPEAREETKTSMPISMLCFRPNIVVAGGTAWQEDTWAGKTLKLGSVSLEVIAPCARCLLPNVNPVEGKRRKNLEPRKSLESSRTGRNPRLIGLPRVKDEAVYFGMHARQVFTKSRSLLVSVGDEVSLS